MKATIEKILPLLCCPKTGKALSFHNDYLKSEEGTLYPIQDGIANFVFEPETGIHAKIKKSYNSIANGPYDKMVKNRKLMRLLWGIDLNQVPAIDDLVKNYSKGIIIDVPCGTSVYEVDAYTTSPETTFIAIDYSKAMISAAKERCKKSGIENVVFILADVNKLPIRESSVDGCLSLNSFHVFPDPEKAASEIGRCLKPDALIMTTIICSKRRKRSDFFMKNVMIPQGFFNHSLPVSSYLSMLEDAGFKKSSVQNFGALSFIQSNKASLT